jgi:hypothetical protein
MYQSLITANQGGTSGDNESDGFKGVIEVQQLFVEGVDARLTLQTMGI